MAQSEFLSWNYSLNLLIQLTRNADTKTFYKWPTSPISKEELAVIALFESFQLVTKYSISPIFEAKEEGREGEGARERGRRRMREW